MASTANRALAIFMQKFFPLSPVVICMGTRLSALPICPEQLGVAYGNEWTVPWSPLTLRISSNANHLALQGLHLFASLLPGNLSRETSPSRCYLQRFSTGSSCTLAVNTCSPPTPYFVFRIRLGSKPTVPSTIGQTVCNIPSHWNRILSPAAFRRAEPSRSVALGFTAGL